MLPLISYLETDKRSMWIEWKEIEEQTDKSFIWAMNVGEKETWINRK